MTKPDRSHVKALFGEILEAREAGDDAKATQLLADAEPQLRDAVSDLLNAFVKASGTLLDDSHSTRQDEHPTRSTPTISGYEISDEIGHGGFGIVYRARQKTPIDRPVAVKVLRRELVSDEAITRFRAESALLARMDHDYIAHVFDAGLTDQGQPFVSMQLIDAEPLHHACERMQLSTRQRVELIAQTCDAIQHAHQRAVIHRDLKPANILVEKTTDTIAPRVIDFGIAKLLEDDPKSTHTRASVRLGTPRYMSPEQRAGNLTSDTRVDVYALGAILCELLAGDVPTANINKDNPNDTTITRPSKIASEQPHRTAAHPKTLRGDLDRIVLKACADDPDLRYPSAQAMGEDLRRYLSGLPVSASPPSVIYVARKFVRRHRASVSLAGVLGIALIAAMSIAALKWREASIERDRAQASTNRVAFIGDFLIEMLILSADYNTRGAPPILSESAMSDLADRARAGLADDPDHLLPMLVGIGRFQTQSGYSQQGTQTMRDALDFAIQYHGVPSEEVINIRILLHDLLWGHGLNGAKEQIQLADQESAQLYEDNDPRRLRVLQRADGSIENLQRIIEIYDQMDDVDPAELYHALFALYMQQRFSQTPIDQLPTLKRLYEVAQSHYPPDHSATIDAMALYGDAMSTFAPSHESIDLLTNAYDMAVPKYGFDHFTTESIRRALARTYGTLGQPEKGIPYALDDLKSVSRTYGEESIQYANALFELGRLYQYAEDFESAKESLEQANDLRKQQWPKGHAQIVTSQIYLAQVLYELGEHERAVMLVEEIFPYIQDLRNARTYAAANSVRIQVRLDAGDQEGADALVDQTYKHMKSLGLDDDQMREVLRDN